MLVSILIPSVIYHSVFIYLLCFSCSFSPHPCRCLWHHLFKQCARSVTSTKILVAAGSLLSWRNLRKTNPSLCPCTHHDCHELCGRRAKEMLLVLSPARPSAGRCPLATSVTPSTAPDRQCWFTDPLVGPRCGLRKYVRNEMELFKNLKNSRWLNMFFTL